MQGLSDLVQDARLETFFHSDYVGHTYHDSNPLTGQRSILRHEHWKRSKHLGRGGCGDVWLEDCIEGRQMGALRAVKEIRRPLKETQRPQTAMDYDRELGTLFKFSHRKYARCFVKMLGWYEDAGSFYIAMDYFPLGDLETYIRNNDGPLPEVCAQQITSQLLEGLAFMHQSNFAHRDIKPANILIQSQPPQPWWVKISDFGLSKYFEDSQASSSNKGGTTAYMAPERQGLFASGNDSSRRYPKAADIWALGEMVHVLLTRHHVFQSTYDLFQFAEQGDEFPDIHLRDYNVDMVPSSFIQAMMTAAPGNRLSVPEAQCHQWMTVLPSLYFSTISGNDPNTNTTRARLAGFEQQSIHQAIPVPSLDENGKSLAQVAGSTQRFSIPAGRLSRRGSFPQRLLCRIRPTVIFRFPARPLDSIRPCLSPCGTAVCSKDASSDLEMWNIKEQCLQMIFKSSPQSGPLWRSSRVAFDITGRVLVSGDRGGGIVMYGAIVKRIMETGPRGPVRRLAVSRGGQWVASITDPGWTPRLRSPLYQLWNTTSDMTWDINWFRTDRWRLTEMAFSQDGQFLASVLSDDDTMRIEIRHIPANKPYLSTKIFIEGTSEPALAFSPNGKLVAFTALHCVLLFDMESKTVIFRLDGPTSHIVFSPDSRYLLGSGIPNNVHVWDCNTGMLRVLLTGKHLFCDIALSPDETIFCLLQKPTPSKDDIVYRVGTMTEIEGLIDQDIKGLMDEEMWGVPHS